MNLNKFLFNYKMALVNYKNFRIYALVRFIISKKIVTSDFN